MFFNRSEKELISMYCNVNHSVRVKIAKSILLDRSYNISEVAFKVGYNDPKYFSKCFKKELGITPTEYRESRSRDLKSNHIIENQFVNKLVKMIESDLANNFIRIDVFASKMNVSKSTLYRKIKLLTGLTPCEFIMNNRIKKAEHLLSKDNYKILEVAYEVGFSDAKYFSRCFKLEYGVAPSEFRELLRFSTSEIV